MIRKSIRIEANPLSGNLDCWVYDPFEEAVFVINLMIIGLPIFFTWFVYFSGHADAPWLFKYGTLLTPVITYFICRKQNCPIESGYAINYGLTILLYCLVSITLQEEITLFLFIIGAYFFCTVPFYVIFTAMWLIDLLIHAIKKNI